MMVSSLLLVSCGGSGSSDGGQQPPPPPPPPPSIQDTINVLANRHAISPYVYGGAFPHDAPTIGDSGLTVVRWGGNATSTYNWKLGTDNADNDYYFEDFAFATLNNGADSNSTQFITDVKNAGGTPLMTMVMLPWVAQSAENGSNGHWSFSVAKYGAQCKTDPFNSDAGDGLKTDCATQLTADPTDAYVPIYNDTSTSCPSGVACVYRSQWAAALASAFGSAPHFYNMDNEIDIWVARILIFIPSNPAMASCAIRI